MYVDLLVDQKNATVNVVERVNGQRLHKQYPIDHTAYIRDPAGKFVDLFGNKCKKITVRSKEEREYLLTNSKHLTSEITISPATKCLEANYLNCEPPDLHVAFWDIETGFDEELGYSKPTDAFNPIISIAVYQQWCNRMVCVAMPPKTLTYEDACEIATSIGDHVIVVRTEKELLNIFLDLIEDADIISGWNSESFDITYTINRIVQVLGKSETRRMCLWNELPSKKTVSKTGYDVETYTTVGRIHFDYLQLYKKYNYEERSSYSLNSIAELELGEKKVEYDGTLDQLYKLDFKTFIEYNIHDVTLLDRLDKKLQFIGLANSIAHANLVSLPSAMGAVATTETAIILEAHRLGFVIPDQLSMRKPTDGRAAGGWVSRPKRGLHKWIGSTDLNSLYPSTIRAFNMSPETLVGQVRYHKTVPELEQHLAENKKNSFAGWWNDRFNTIEMDAFLNNDPGEKIFLDLEDGTSFEVSGSELRDLIFNSGQPWCITANGTIFRTDKEGIIPSLLTRWYQERKAKQKIKKEYTKILSTGFKLPERFKE